MLSVCKSPKFKHRTFQNMQYVLSISSQQMPISSQSLVAFPTGRSEHPLTLHSHYLTMVASYESYEFNLLFKLDFRQS